MKNQPWKTYTDASGRSNLAVKVREADGHMEFSMTVCFADPALQDICLSPVQVDQLIHQMTMWRDR